MINPTLAFATLISVLLLTPYYGEQVTSKNVPLGLSSIPAGAIVKLNGTVIGRTNLVYELPPGSYTFTYSFPGFSDATATYDISDTPNLRNGGTVELPDGPSFVRLKAPFEGNYFLSWVGFTNQLQVPTSDGSAIYNAETRVSGVEAASATVPQLRQQLHLIDEYTSTSLTGHYFVYSPNIAAHPPSEGDPLIFHIYDTQTGKTMTGTFTAGAAQVNPTKLKWSRSEEWALVSGDYGLAYYLHIQNDQITIIDGSSCKLDTGDVWYVSPVFSDLPFSGPNSHGSALIKTHNGDPNSTTGYACIVDLTTLKGTLVPVPDALGAVFSPDEKSVYLINQEGVARYDIGSKQTIWLSRDLSYITQPNNNNVSSSFLSEGVFSNTAQYAIVGDAIDNDLYEWVYKIPQSPASVSVSP